MDSKQISLIGLKLIAIYLVAQGVSSLPNIYLFLSTYDASEGYTLLTYGSVIISIFSPIIVGILVWYSASKLSSYISKSTTGAIKPPSPDLYQYQVIAITLIGLYLFASALPYAISINYQLLIYQDTVNDQAVFNRSLLANAISINLKALFGAVLIIGSRKLSALFSWLRQAGT